MGTVTQIRRDILPKELYELIERFMFGEILSLQITTLSTKMEIGHYSFGNTPRPLANIAANNACEVYEIRK